MSRCKSTSMQGVLYSSGKWFYVQTTAQTTIYYTYEESKRVLKHTNILLYNIFCYHHTTK